MGRWLSILMAGFFTAATAGSAVAKDAQDQGDETFAYYQVNGLVYVFDFDQNAQIANRLKASFKIPRPPLRFDITGIHKEADKAYYVIRFRHIVSDSPYVTALADYSSIVNMTNSDRYYAVDQSLFQDYLNSGYIEKRQKTGFLDWRSVVYGATLALPFKLRPYDEEFHRSRKLTTNISLGGYAGLEWRISSKQEFYLDAPVVSAGLTLLPINAGTTKDGAEGDGSVPGVYWAVGAVAKLDNFQLGFMFGRDYAEGDTGKNWIYNGKTWYSFTIGYSFLTQSVQKDPPITGPKTSP